MKRSRLNERQKMVARMLVGGFKTKEIAKQTGYSEARVSVLRTDERVRNFVAELSDNVTKEVLSKAADRSIVLVRRRAQEEAERSFEKLVEMRDDPGTSPGVKHRTTMSLLEIAGISKAEEKTQAATVVINLDQSCGILNADDLVSKGSIEVEEVEQ